VRAALDALRREVDDLTAMVGTPTEPDGRVRDPDAVEAMIGEVLFATVAVARKAGLDAESALRRATTGFAQRHERFMALAASRGIEVVAADEATLRALFEEASTSDDLEP
jgi:ATP diphosphatase